MFIAHIPVGLALARRITRQPLTGGLIGVASLGAIFPDLDLIRFYIFDNHQRHHHDYWTHIPSVWVGILTAWYVLRRLLGRSFGLMPAVFFGGVMSHLVLDTMAGKIEWLWPISNQGINLVSVPATHSSWIFSFIMHWTFVVELWVSIFCLWVAFRGTRDSRSR